MFLSRRQNQIHLLDMFTSLSNVHVICLLFQFALDKSWLVGCAGGPADTSVLLFELIPTVGQN